MPEADADGLPPSRYRIGGGQPTSIYEVPGDLKHASAGLTICAELLLVIGNILPILVVLLVKTRITRTNLDLIILVLSCCDVLSVVIPGPIWLLHYATGEWLGGRPLCLFYQILCVILQVSSMILVVLLCLDRVGAMCYLCRHSGDGQHHHSNGSTGVHQQQQGHGLCIERLHTKRTLSLCVGVILSATGVALLPLLHMAPAASDPTASRFCVNWLARLPRSLSESVFFYVFVSLAGVCLCAVIVSNFTLVCLWRYLRRKSAALWGERPHPPPHPPAIRSVEMDAVSDAASEVNRRCFHGDIQVSAFFQTCRVVGLISFCYLCSWIPTLVAVTLLFLRFSIPPPVILYALLSTTLSGVFNPFIYLVCSDAYREGYRLVLKRFSWLCACCCPWTRRATRLRLSANENGHTGLEPPGLLSTSNLPRDETTQFVLSATSSHYSMSSRTAAYPEEDDINSDVYGKDFLMKKFFMQNPSFDVSEEASELL